MSNITRRNLLKQSPAVLALTAIPTAGAGAVPCGGSTQSENRDLLAAYERFISAREELAAANDALEWLVDEWRHRWPLAPEEILGCANVDEYTKEAERDIAGNVIFRKTAYLRQNLKRDFVEKHPHTCFQVYPPEFLQEVIERWERPRTGKTEKALARNIAEQRKVLSEYRHKLRISEQYHAEVARLRMASGVESVNQRLKASREALNRACVDVSNEPAFTVEGLRMKAAALMVQDDGMAPYLCKKGGALGAMARFIDEALNVIGRP